MGIRAESKKFYRDKILNASRELFISQGYENTTIEQIAEKARVGLGTAYNYFKSKEELFILAIADDMADKAENDLGKLNYPGCSASEIVYNAIFIQIKRMNWANKKMWRIAFPIILNSMSSDRLPIREVLRADFKMMERIKELIRQMKEYNLISGDFDEDTANDLIFSALFYHLSLYIYSDEATFEEVLDRIRNNIEFVFGIDGRHNS